MRKVLTERNLVVFLFVVALVVFSLAQEDAKKVEKMYLGTGAAAVSAILAAPQNTADVPATAAEQLEKK